MIWFLNLHLTKNFTNFKTVSVQLLKAKYHSANSASYIWLWLKGVSIVSSTPSEHCHQHDCALPLSAVTRINKAPEDLATLLGAAADAFCPHFLSVYDTIKDSMILQLVLLKYGNLFLKNKRIPGLNKQEQTSIQQLKMRSLQILQRS